MTYVDFVVTRQEFTNVSHGDVLTRYHAKETVFLLTYCFIFDNNISQKDLNDKKGCYYIISP